MTGVPDAHSSRRRPGGPSRARRGCRRAAAVCSGSDLLARLARQEPQAYARLEREAVGIANGRGLLWRIGKAGAAPSYLFGTVHLSDPRLTRLPEAVSAAIRNARTAAFEIAAVFDPAAEARVQRLGAVRGFRLGAGGLAGIPGDARPALEKALERRGLSWAVADRMQPWMVVVALQLPPAR